MEFSGKVGNRPMNKYELMVKFWWRCGSPSGYRDCFPDLSLLGESGIIRLRCAKMQCRACTSRHSHWYRDTGNTCLGGGMHCPSASSSNMQTTPSFWYRPILMSFEWIYFNMTNSGLLTTKWSLILRKPRKLFFSVQAGSIFLLLRSVVLSK